MTLSLNHYHFEQILQTNRDWVRLVVKIADPQTSGGTGNLIFNGQSYHDDHGSFDFVLQCVLPLKIVIESETSCLYVNYQLLEAEASQLSTGESGGPLEDRLLLTDTILSIDVQKNQGDFYLKTENITAPKGTPSVPTVHSVLNHQNTNYESGAQILPVSSEANLLVRQTGHCLINETISSEKLSSGNNGFDFGLYLPVSTHIYRVEFSSPIVDQVISYSFGVYQSKPPYAPRVTHNDHFKYV